MLVDDDPDTLDLFGTGLRQAGAEVRTALSVADAFSALHGWRADIVVSDIAMPEEDGFTLIRRLRAEGTRERIPAIALIAFGSAEDRIRLLAAGFDWHVPKPVDPAELVAITGGLARRRSERHVSRP
jgi:DNA-binding response OmpR family regulator